MAHGDDWIHFVGQDGRTAAHEAAEAGLLPAGFDNWDVADYTGWSVAHVAAVYGTLPEGFDRWDIRDDDGTTVAHVAASCGQLPEDFDRWDLRDGRGWTVAETHDDYVKSKNIDDYDGQSPCSY